jgi:hypothetical protein
MYETLRSSRTAAADRIGSPAAGLSRASPSVSCFGPKASHPLGAEHYRISAARSCESTELGSRPVQSRVMIGSSRPALPRCAALSDRSSGRPESACDARPVLFPAAAPSLLWPLSLGAPPGSRRPAGLFPFTGLPWRILPEVGTITQAWIRRVGSFVDSASRNLGVPNEERLLSRPVEKSSTRADADRRLKSAAPWPSARMASRKSGSPVAITSSPRIPVTATARGGGSILGAAGRCSSASWGRWTLPGPWRAGSCPAASTSCIAGRKPSAMTGGRRSTSRSRACWRRRRGGPFESAVVGVG